MENNLKILIHSKRKQKPNGYITVNKQEICHQTLKFELGNELELNQTLTMIRFQENKWASVIIEFADFYKTSLSFCTLEKCVFSNVDFSTSYTISSTLKYCCFYNCTWNGESRFVNSTFINCVFSGGSVCQAEWKSCTFICTKFELDFNTAILMSCEFSNNYDKSIQFDKEVYFMDVQHQINSINDDDDS